MRILQKYLLRQFLRNLAICLTTSVLLFTIIDFFDRIDVIAGEETTIGAVIIYFLLKVPVTLHLMLPVSTLVATLLTVGLLSKNSEVTAIRASGIPLFSFAQPLLLTGMALSFVALGFSEVVVPYCSRKSHEIYNIDIRKKDQLGKYSQDNFWWRNGDTFYTTDAFDSRTNTLHSLTALKLDDSFRVIRRLDADKTTWIDANLGWMMLGVNDQHFSKVGELNQSRFKRLPLPIEQEPRFFYDLELDPESMGYFSFRRYMAKLKRDGIPINSYISDLRAKLSFPFVNFICVLVALPFALKSARQGGMALHFIAGVIIGFTYFFVHSLALALGRAELLDPTASAWAANLLLGFVGLILNWGAEAP